MLTLAGLRLLPSPGCVLSHSPFLRQAVVINVWLYLSLSP